MTTSAVKPESLLAIFESRRSTAYISSDAVPSELLDHVLASGATANDHGGLNPWRFIVFKGDGRKCLADVFVKHEAGERTPNIDKALAAPFRAPVVIAVVSDVVDCKIPVSDQLYCAASACQLMTLSASMLGLASIWRTGKYAVSDQVRAFLSVKGKNEIVGFIYLGYAVRENARPRVRRPDRILVMG